MKNYHKSNKRQQIINYLLNLSKKPRLSNFEKWQYRQVANLLKYKQNCDSKYWYKAKDILQGLAGIVYSDDNITIYDDCEKGLFTLVNDRGKATTINYDDNFFYQEQILDEYLKLLKHSFKKWGKEELDSSDYEEICEIFNKFYKHINRYDDFNLELADQEVRELLFRK